jgi:signal transduction histidine kinase
VAALDREVRRWRQYSGIPARLRAEALPNPLPLQPTAEVALFRIVQEALANVARHSNARRVEVSLARHDGALEVCVSDDGDGFDAEAPPQRGSFGLLGMGERARLAGGSLDVSSTRGEGTRVVVRLPLGEAAVPVSVPA